MQEHLRLVLARIEALEKQKTPPPACVTANVKKPQAEEKKPCKKRDAMHHQGRPRTGATHSVEHQMVRCPDGHLRLGGISLARVRAVSEVSPPPPVDVTHHRIFTAWCAQCQHWHDAPADVHAEVRGQGRIGVRLSRLSAAVRTVRRVPIRQIRALLPTLHGCDVSLGETGEGRHRLRSHAQPVLDDRKATIRASPAVHADETGWREDGLHGEIWSVSTPTVRSDEEHPSCAGDVVTHVMGEDVQGVPGSDVYAGDTIHAGWHHRWWAHVLRDIHDLKNKVPQDEALLLWATEVKAISDDAVAWAHLAPDPHLMPRAQHQARVMRPHAYEQRLGERCKPLLPEDVPQQTLCTRVERCVPERCVCVAVPGVPAHPTLAERSVRPLVIARTIRGGSRSPKGSQTRMGLASLCGSWMAHGLHPFSQCLALLTQPHP